MASLEFILSETEWQSLFSKREYAKQLFQVDINRKDEYVTSLAGGPSSPPGPMHGNKKSDSDRYDSGIFPTNFSMPENILGDDEDFILRPPPVIVQIQTESSHSNLEKCRKFAIACSPSNPDFKFITIKLENQKSSEMVKACLPSIRQSTATLVDYYPESLDITIQGHQSCVELARDRIDMILQSNSAETHDQYNDNSDHSSSALLEAKNSSFLKNSSNGDIHYHHDLLSERLSSQTMDIIIPSPAKSEDSVFFSGDQDLYNFSASSKLMSKEYDIPDHSDTVTSNYPPFQAYSKSCDENIESDCSSNSEQDNILAGDHFSKHIDQARKLGFSEEQILKVLRRLEVNSSIEDMMRELVLDPLGLNQDDGMKKFEALDDDEINLSSKWEDSDDSEEFDVNDSSNLRHIIIDGSNVAMSHGQKMFSCLGIKIVVDWFKSRGHKNITVFVPQWRKEASRPDSPITNQEILAELEEERIVVFTPSRRIGGTRIVCYDDRYILQLAVQKDGIVVSNDVYRDLVRERDDFKEVVEKRLLMFSFVQDTFMPPEDPLGRYGPPLDNFLRIKPSEPKNKPQLCPYGKKCTYGNKCRFYHPERRYASQKMVAEKLKESAELKMKSSKAEKSAETVTEKGRRPKQKLLRTVSLVPHDVSDNAHSDVIPGQTKKPPLHHSKSLVYHSSYLTDLRLKMEEAESAETLQQPPFANIPLHHREVNPGQSHTPVRNEKDKNPTKNQCSNSCNPSPRTSPTCQTESAKTNVKAVQSFPSSPVLNLPPSCPVNGVNSTLIIPNPESQDRYLSGHLLVVKSLSDEVNSNGNFFSQHTSRAPGSLQGNQTSAFNGHRSLSTGSNPSLVSPMLQVSTSKQLGEKEIQESHLWNGQEIYMPPEITTRVDYNELARSSQPIFPTNSFLPKERKHNPSPTHSLIVCPISDQCNSCPTFSQKDVNDLPEKQTFKRSLSSNTSSPGEYCKPPSEYPRKYSLNTIITSKPNSSVPLNQRISYNQYNTNAPPFQSQFQRSRLNYDSGISSGGLGVDQPLNSPFSPENYSSPFNYTTNMPSPAIYSPTTNNPGRFMTTQQETMFNSSQSGLSSPGVSFQFSPLPNRMPPSFQDQSRTQSHVPMPNLSLQTQHSPILHPPPLYSTMGHYMACPPPSQPPLQPNYPQTMSNNESRFYPMSLHGAGDSPLPYSRNTPLSPFLQQSPSIQPQAKMIDAEAAISVEDPRYSVYYNLSSVFGERAVRTFMNRNPDVRNVNELYSLIASYKQDTGI